MDTGKQILLFIAVALVTFVVTMAIVRGSAAKPQEQQYSAQTLVNNAERNNAGLQEATLSMQGYQYIVSPSSLRVGVPVRMTVDIGTVTGCMRTVVIPAFSVRKTVSAGDNVIEFTPLKTGTIRMTCGMGMGQGSFTVTDDGSGKYQAAPAIQAAAGSTGGSCGAGGGGCGCGGR